MYIYNKNKNAFFKGTPERGKDMAKSLFVNEFKIGDKIIVHGWAGTVSAIDHTISHYNGEPCTYLTVNFDEPEKIGYQYEGGTFGGTDNIVSYGYIEK